MIKKKFRRNRDVPKTVGTIIKEHREKAGYSKTDLAQLFHDDVERIEKWENNCIEPSVSECKILSKLFSVSMDEMFASVDVIPLVSNQPAFETVTQLNRLSNRWYE